MLKGLGAAQVVDYNAPSLVDDLVAALEGTEIAGALHAAGDAAACCEVVARCAGRRFVSSTLGLPEDVPDGVEGAQVFRHHAQGQRGRAGRVGRLPSGPRWPRAATSRRPRRR